MPDFVHSTLFLHICSITTFPRRPCLENEEVHLHHLQLKPKIPPDGGILIKLSISFHFTEKGRLLRGQELTDFVS